MTVDLPELAFLLFEALTILAAVRAARRLGLVDDEPGGPPLATVLILGGSLCASALIAAVLTFAHVNHTASYLAAAVGLVLALSAPRPRDVADDARWLWSRWSEVARTRVDWAATGVAVVLLGPALFVCLRAPIDIDSTLAMGSVIDWAANRAAPYHFVYFNSYPATWELCFLPGVVITGSDLWVWWVGAKAVLLVAAAACAIARRLGLSRLAALILTVSVVALRHHWWPAVSGVGTLKNDAVVGAGFLIVVLALLELVGGRDGKRSAVLLVLGSVWLTAKFSGLVPAGLAVVCWLGLAFWRKVVTARTAAWWGALGVAAWLALSGHFYLHNLVAYGNALYPAAVAIGGHAVAPGPLDLRGTSILANLHDPRLPDIPVDAPTVLGPGFWFVLVVGGLGAAATLLRALVPGRFGRRQGASIVVSLFVLAGWAWYPSLYFSAGQGVGDLRYLNDLNSFRYAIGPLALTEIWSALLLAELTGLEIAAPAFAAFSLGGRWLVLLSQLVAPALEFQGLTLAVILTVAACGCWVLFRRVVVPHAQVWVAATGVALLLWGAPSAVEHWRERDWNAMAGGSIIRAWADRAPSSVGVVASAPAWAPAYRLAGRHFQHDVRVYPAREAFERDPGPPPFLAYFSNPARMGTPAGVEETIRVADAMLQRGYCPVEFGLDHLLAERRAAAPDAVVVGVANKNGTETVAGKPFWWLGAGTTRVYVWVRHPGTLQMTLQGAPGPNAAPGASGQLRVTDVDGAAQVLSLSQAPATFRVHVPAGARPLALDPLGPVVPRQSADSRPLVLSVSNIAVSVERDEASTPAAPACSFELTDGWYKTERNAKGWLRWSGHAGGIAVAWPRGGAVTIGGEFASITRRNAVDIALDGRVLASLATQAPAFGFEPIGKVTLTLPPGGGRLTMTSRNPGIVMPPDTRQLGFALRNLTVATSAGACAARP